MKKLFLPLFLIISSVAFGQGLPFPNYQQFASPTTRTNFLGAAHTQKGLINGMYQDTTVANQGFIDFYPGAQIVTISPANAIWLRNSTATEWIRQASSSNSPPPSVVTIITDSSIQICNVNSCDTFVVNVTAQTINVTNDSTIIVCSFGGSCDTVTINPTPIIPTGVFVDSVFLHHGILTDSLFYSKDGDTILVNVFDRNCGLISGGTVTYNSLLIFDIAPSVFVDCCTGIRYSFDGAQKTLAAAHVSLPRRDAIIVSSSGISVLTGTPATNPADPQLTPCQELLTFVTVPAGATTITCATPDKIPYDENTTFVVTTTSVTANPDNLVNPFHLTKAIDVGAVTTASKITLTTTAFDISPYTTLKFYVRLKATFTNAAQITLRWFTTGGTFVSNQLSIPSGSYGFVRTTINTYQVISIPMSAFSFTNSTVTGIQIGFGASNATGLYIDYMQLGGVCFVQPEPVTLPNGFGVIQTPSGAAISTQPNDITNFIGAGNIAITASGKTVTFNGTSTGSTVTIINDSTVQVCTAQGSCQTIVFSDVDAQNVWVINDTTLLVCNVTNTLCDTVDIPNPVFFDRAFFTPNQASLGNTDHFFNGFDLYGHGGTFIMDDDGLAIKASSLITPIQAVNNHTDLTTVKTGVFMGREVAGNGAVGLGIQLRTAIDNASSNQVAASDLITEWSVATAGSETATMKFNVVGAGALANRFSIEGSTRIIADGIRLQDAKGADVAAANDLTLGNAGNLFTITGATQINAITTTNWQAGSNISFIFTGAPLLKNNTAGGANTATMLLAGRVDFQAAAGDYIAFEYDGTNWYETNRKLAATGGVYTFRSGLTESPATIVELGGTLLDLTTITALSPNNLIVTGDVAPFSANATTGIGVTSTATSGIAMTATATTGLASSFLITPAGTTDIQPVIYVKRNSSGTPAAGMGGSIDFWLETTLFERLTSRIASVFTDATDATRTAELQFFTTNSTTSAIKSSLAGSGQWRHHNYGSGTFTGTATKWLAVTSTGLVIEEDAPSGVNIYNSDGALEGTRTVTTAGFNTTWTGSNTPGAMFTVNNTNTGSGTYAIAGVAAANAAAVTGTNVGTGAGILGTATSGTGVQGVSTTGLAISGSVNPSSNSTVVNIMEITRLTSNAASGANGIGGRIQFTVENESGGTRLAAALDAVFTEITDATRMSKFIINTVSDGVTREKLIVGGNTTLTESSATTFHSHTITGSTAVGGEIVVTVEANDATDFQSRTLRFIWSAVNKSNTTTVAISTPEEAVAVSSGTLTVTITAVDAGGGVINFKADAASSLTQTVLRASATAVRNY